jgi:hypothetical protein
MRLTLRTLLAYRDGVLDPADASILESKIQESSTAQKISERIELEMRNRRIAPIPVDAREFGFEANLVSEFLDDTIPTATLPEMERQCLENSMLLSEIGSCHQILAHAIAIPVSIPSSLRQRIRELPRQTLSHAGNLSNILEKHGHLRRVDPAVTNQNTNAKLTEVSSVAEPVKSLRKQGVDLRPTGIELSDGLGRQVPEYLIGSDRGWMKRFAMAAVLLISLVAVGTVAIGPLGRVQELLRKSETNGDPTAAKKAPRLLDKKIARSEPKVAPKPEIVVRDSVPIAIESDARDSGANDAIESAPIVESDAAPPMSIASTNAKPPTTSDRVPAEPEAERSRADSIPVPAANPANAPFQAKMQWLPESKESSGAIVLKRSSDEAKKGSWNRVIAGEDILPSEQIVVPPFQRTEIRIEPGIRCLCVGENDFELTSGQPDAVGKGRITVYSGRMILFPTPDSQDIELICDSVKLGLHFNKPNASCAFEVVNGLQPMDDEQLQAGKLAVAKTVRVFCLGESLDISSTGLAGDSVENSTLSVGEFVVWNQGKMNPKQDLSEKLAWFTSSIQRPIDQLAANDTLREFSSNNELDVTAILTKLHLRSGEVGAMAARTRMMLGQFSQLFSSDGIFNRKGMHIHWQPMLVQLQQSLGREANRDALVSAIQQESAGHANAVLTLIVPRSQSQLVSGADKLLVESLSSTSLDERVLAINQLTTITKKNLGFQPEKIASESILAWRKSLARGEIRYPESKDQEKVNKE